MAAATIGLGAATLAVGLTVWWWRTSSRTRASRRLGPSSTSTPSSALTTPQVEPDGRHQLRVGRALSAPSRSAAQDLIYAIHDRDIKEAKGRRASVRLFYRQSNQEELCFTRSITGGGLGGEYHINGNPVTWDQMMTGGTSGGMEARSNKWDDSAIESLKNKKKLETEMSELGSRKELQRKELAISEKITGLEKNLHYSNVEQNNLRGKLTKLASERSKY
ncbi:hypothetical protein SORBI_3008G075300 [Sorghum bicolor]|uniref:Uncharacterized protein n=1 Tax=Sorghum bicolor TaxID=4558 RepID=C5YTP9_SORBI|nr:hypothetical protein SORBI_3008G075300 [Sorghum bicolor]